jgi:PAS domain S-box-containing protein
LEKTVALNATILQAERRLHLLAAVAFTLSFTLLIFYWSRRIEGVLKQIHGFSQRVIGESREFRVRGDALWQLEEDFIRLRAELFGARELLRQQQVEMERLKQLELLETVAEHLGIGVVLLGPEGNVALKTQRVERLEATLGEGWYRPSLGWSGEKRELVLEGELQRPVTFMVTRLSLFREDDVVLYQDVTERTRLRTRLHEQKLQLHRVTQSARDAIVSIDVHGNVVQWNRAAETLFQHSALEVLGRPVTRIMPEAYREALRSALRRTATSGVAHLVGKTLELEGLRKDGTTAVIELSLSSFEYKKTTFIPVSSGISPSANGQKRPFRKANRGFPRSWTIYRQRSSSRRPIAGCFLSMSI